MAERKRALIEITRVDLHGVEAALNRIADALEIAVGLRPIPTSEEAATDSAIAYSTEDDLLRAEFASAITEEPEI